MEVLRSGALVLRFPGSRPDHQRMSFQRCHSPGISQPLGCQPAGCVTECKLAVLAARQVSKLRDQLLGQVTATSVGKPADQERRWEIWVPKNHLARVGIQASFILKGKGIKSNLSWTRPAAGENMLVTSRLQSFIGGPGQDVSCELNKDIYLNAH